MHDFEVFQYEKIHYYKNVIKQPDILIDLIEDTDIILNKSTGIEKWKWWRRPSDNYGKIKNITEGIKNETNPLILSIGDQISTGLLNTLDHYNSIHNVEIEKDFMYGYRTTRPLSINKYFTNAELSSHVDSFGDDNSPVLSAVMYLNDDYDGGNIHFKNQDIDIKPEAGSVVIFPSTPPYYHESKKILRGTKYMVLQFWFKPSIMESLGLGNNAKV
jgi:hypothetical protein